MRGIKSTDICEVRVSQPPTFDPADARVLVAFVGEDDELDYVTDTAMELARRNRARLILYDRDAASAFRGPAAQPVGVGRRAGAVRRPALRGRPGAPGPRAAGPQGGGGAQGGRGRVGMAAGAPRDRHDGRLRPRAGRRPGAAPRGPGGARPGRPAQARDRRQGRGRARGDRARRRRHRRAPGPPRPFHRAGRRPPLGPSQRRRPAPPARRAAASRSAPAAAVRAAGLWAQPGPTGPGPGPSYPARSGASWASRRSWVSSPRTRVARVPSLRTNTVSGSPIALKAAATLAPWSIPTGQVPPCSRTNVRAAPALSLTSTPRTTSPCGRRSSRVRRSSGNSRTHGPHQVAQKFSSTGWPR